MCRVSPRGLSLPAWRVRFGFKVGVPSRTEVAEYRDLGSQVNELVGRINGNYGTLEYSPVHYINQSISQVREVGL